MMNTIVCEGSMIVSTDGPYNIIHSNNPLHRQSHLGTCIQNLDQVLKEISHLSHYLANPFFGFFIVIG